MKKDLIINKQQSLWKRVYQRTGETCVRRKSLYKTLECDVKNNNSSL